MPEYSRVCQSMTEYASVCQSMPEYFQLLWAELFLDLLLCKRVTVRQLHRQVLPMYCQSTFNFFGLNSFLTYCCAGELQFASCNAKCFQCTVRVLSIFFGLSSFLTYCCAG